MNKRFFRSACILLTALLLAGLAVSGAVAENAAFPINPPPAFGQVPAHFSPFSGEPVEYTVTLQVDEETGLRTYTIPDPLAWGLAASVPGVWEYDPDNGWQRTGDAEGGQVQLLVSAEAFEAEGCPMWGAPCTKENTFLNLNIYLGELRHLYAYVDYQFENGIISIAADDGSFTLSNFEPHGEEEAFGSLYASYDPAGVLAYAAFNCFAADQSLISYTVQADVASQSYVLTDMSSTDAEGNIVFWSSYDGQWQNDDFEPVDAPEGISAENLPFTVTGGWAGVPFEQPGDKPEGTFPVADLPSDPELDIKDYLPWPEDADLYRSLRDAGPFPAFPVISWATREDGACVFTIEGLSQWDAAGSLQGTYEYDPEWEDWRRPPTCIVDYPLELLLPAGVDASTVYWTPGPRIGDLTMFLSRDTLTVEMNGNFYHEGSWSLNNKGWASLTRPLDGNRTLEAIYDDYTLQEYNIHQSDENGNRLAQACYQPSETDPAVFELGCFFLYSPEMDYEEALWLKDIGWYSYETGEPCDAPEGVDLTQYPPLTVK